VIAGAHPGSIASNNQEHEKTASQGQEGEMQVLLQRVQKGKVFSIWIKYELAQHEEELVDKYNIRKVVLVAGNPWQEFIRSLKMAAAVAVVIGLIAIPFFGTPLAAISWGIPAFVIACPVIYSRIKETIRVTS
jgi:preprotein translocase subunit Sss1